MTGERVFCKDCIHHEVVGREHVCQFKNHNVPKRTGTHPVHGEIEVDWILEDCRKKNARCNCSDYATEKTKKGHGPMFKRFLKGLEKEKKYEGR